MYHIELIGHLVKTKAFTAAVTLTLCLSSIPSAIASCNASAPYLLSLFLSGQKISDTIHEQQVNQTAPNPSLSALHLNFSRLQTSLWGFYWVNIYSRRLHEVLDQLDSKPPGPITQYYDRWDGTQLAGSSSMLKRDVDIVGKLLPHTQELAAELTASMQQFLRQIETEIAGCPPQPPTD